MCTSFNHHDYASAVNLHSACISAWAYPAPVLSIPGSENIGPSCTTFLSATVPDSIRCGAVQDSPAQFRVEDFAIYSGQVFGCIVGQNSVEHSRELSGCQIDVLCGMYWSNEERTRVQA